MGFHKYRSDLWSEPFRRILEKHDPLHPFHNSFKKSAHLHPIDRVFLADYKTYLSYDYLVKIDRASMANSMECRSPFLDTDLLNFSGRIPSLLKFKNRRTKYILKKIGENYLPKDLLYSEKRGFGIPVDQWLCHQLKEVCAQIIFNKKALQRNFFNYDHIRKIWNEHCRYIYNHKHCIWALLWFELWYQMFIEKSIDRNTPLDEVPKIIN